MCNQHDPNVVILGVEESSKGYLDRPMNITPRTVLDMAWFGVKYGIMMNILFCWVLPFILPSFFVNLIWFTVVSFYTSRFFYIFAKLYFAEYEVTTFLLKIAKFVDDQVQNGNSPIPVDKWNFVRSILGTLIALIAPQKKDIAVKKEKDPDFYAPRTMVVGRCNCLQRHEGECPSIKSEEKKEEIKVIHPAREGCGICFIHQVPGVCPHTVVEVKQEVKVEDTPVVAPIVAPVAAVEVPQPQPSMGTPLKVLIENVLQPLTPNQRAMFEPYINLLNPKEGDEERVRQKFEDSLVAALNRYFPGPSGNLDCK